ncbi:MAG TPA: DUF1343 domain-containing protein [Longimicrobiales bacterium]|nr:DUF1343 domain-containing protein [Longimicrobiales bacterium]
MIRLHRAAAAALLSATVQASGSACAPPAADAEARHAEPAPALRAGVAVLLSDSLHLVRGRRVGLVTNHTGVFQRDVGQAAGAPRETGGTIDALHESPEFDLVALFGPEHGIRGVAEAGARVDSDTDQKTGLPIHSLYGSTLRPTPDMLEGIDVLLFDMQDVGARYYTYPSTMAYAMEAAGAAGIPFVVLDRPNPIRGDVTQGNVLDTAFSTFVGLYATPMRHGMTLGELARLYVGEFGIDVELHVVPVDGWRRDMAFDETGLPWVAPSPNIPDLASALAYPGTCLFEGTSLSVGRGTERAFQWVGAPWLDGAALADTLNGYGFEGVRFEPATFTPHQAGDDKFSDVEVHGVRLVAGSSTYDAPVVAVAMLVEAYRLSGDKWSWNERHFDRLAGTDALRLGIIAGEDVATLTAGWPAEIAAFEALRAPYLVYR